MRVLTAVLSLSLVPACLAGDEPLATTAEPATRGPSTTVDHGELPRPIDAWTEAALTSRDRVHTWQLTLDGPGRLSVATGRVGGARAVDTVLSLHRETASGWGRAIARDDDGGEGPLSALDRELPAGHYRIAVSGYAASTRGAFALTVACSGDGCGEPAPTCAFGDTYREIDRTRFAFGQQVVLTAASALDPVMAAQVVRAVQASAHSDVTTPAEAFDRVDQNQINRLELRDAIGVRLYVAYEYGAGDNSYGAIFLDRATEPATEIHDGDLVECTVTDAACLFGQLNGDVRDNPDFAITRDVTFGARTAVSDLEAAQMLAAGRLQLPELNSASDLFNRVTDAEVRRLEVTHSPSGRAFALVTYILGDHRFGAGFVAGTTAIAVEIEDDVLARCDAF